MAIYRPPPPRWRAAVLAGAAGLAAGLAVGAGALGRREPDPAQALRRVRTALDGAASLLEVVDVEYREGVRGGVVVRRREYEAALQALARSRSRFGEVREAVAVLHPEGTVEVERQYARLRRLVATRPPPEEVTARTALLRQALRELLGPRGPG